MNIHKSNLYAVGVNAVEVAEFAKVVGCMPDKLPFSYPGLHVGQNMSRVVGYNLVLERFQKKPSKWKLTTLSFGGRAMLLKYVLGLLGLYFMSFFFMLIRVANKLEALRSIFFGRRQGKLKHVMD